MLDIINPICYTLIGATRSNRQDLRSEQQGACHASH